MARFDVYRNANKATRTEIPFLLDVQANLFRDLDSRIVVPLMVRAAVPHPMTRLNPVFTVAGREVVLSTTDMAGVPISVLGPKVASLAADGVAIINAIDFLLTGV